MYASYKHAIVVHGHGSAFRLARHFAAGQLVILHESLHEEWYYAFLKPWVHYVPLSTHMRDLPRVLGWVKANPGRVKAIADAGAQLFDEKLGYAGSLRFVHALLTALSAAQRELNVSALVQKFAMHEHPLSRAKLGPRAPRPTLDPVTGCADWGCTCQGFSDKFDTWTRHWGGAESEDEIIKDWWVHKKCNTRPIGGER